MRGVDLFHVHKQSAYLVGRDRIVSEREGGRGGGG